MGLWVCHGIELFPTDGQNSKVIGWGTLLPWGVAIANRTRTVSNAKPGAWQLDPFSLCTLREREMICFRAERIRESFVVEFEAPILLRFKWHKRLQSIGASPGSFQSPPALFLAAPVVANVGMRVSGKPHSEAGSCASASASYDIVCTSPEKHCLLLVLSSAHQGWLIQLVGFGMAIWHVQEYLGSMVVEDARYPGATARNGTHFSGPHQIIGLGACH